MRTPFCTALALIASCLGLSAQPAPTAESEAFFGRKVAPFFKAYCIECHGGDNARASFYTDRLDLDFSNPKNAGKWQEVMDAINLGEMPPEEEKQPTSEDVFAVASWIGEQILEAQVQSRMAGGQILLRRLNRDEYANTVVDLLGLDPGRIDTIRSMLPADGTADGFDRIAAALFIDETQMENYLQTAGYVSKLALLDTPIAPQKVTWLAHERLNFGGETQRAHAMLKDAPQRTGFKTGERRENGIVAWNAINQVGTKTDPNQFQAIAHGSPPGLTELVAQDGYYRVRFLAGAFQGNRGGPIKMKFSYGEKSPIEISHIVTEIQGTIENPQWQEFMIFLRAPVGDQKVRMTMTANILADVRITDPAYLELSRGFVRAADTLKKAIEDKAPAAEIQRLEAERKTAIQAIKAYQGTIFIQNPEYQLAEVPKIFLGTVEIEGPISEWPPKSHLAMGIQDGEPINEATLRRIFSQFLPRAFRRPVEPAHANPYIEGFLQARREFGFSPVETLRYGLQSILVSPDFLLVQEPQIESAARPLNDFEFANRLSYFLWNSMPDAELFSTAAAGRLSDPSIRRQQVDRMLKDPKAERFIESFAGQWLDVRRFGSVQPSTEYLRRVSAPRYDNALEQASKMEPIAFFRYILENNLPITNFIDSDFLTINQRLAQHYQIPGVEGPEFRKVSIPPDVERGGVLGMVGLLTLLSDGTRTLPVTRATWVREKLFHAPPPPPPPGAGEIQPNTSGEKLTVRQRLELHRKEPTCASCHAGLDGYGLALENYDAIGAWRTRQDGEGIRNGGEIDPSGQLESGRTFSTLAEYKQALLEERDRFGRAFVTQLLTYALTRPVGVIDKETVNQIYRRVENDEFRIQSVVHGITNSELFLTK